MVGDRSELISNNDEGALTVGLALGGLFHHFGVFHGLGVEVGG